MRRLLLLMLTVSLSFAAADELEEFLKKPGTSVTRNASNEITGLSFFASLSTAENLALLTKLTKLKKVTFNIVIGNKLDALPELPQVKEIVVTGGLKGENAISILKKAPNVDRFSLLNVDIGLIGLEEPIALDAETIEQILSFRKWEKLGFSNGELTPDHFKKISEMESLKELSLSLQEPSDELMKALASCTQLESLEIGTLEPWTFRPSDIKPAQLKLLKPLTKLKKLSLFGINSNHAPFANEDLGFLKDLTILEELDFETSKTANGAFKGINTLSALRKFNLGSGVVGIEDMEAIQHWTNLRSLKIYISSTDESFAKIGKLKKLEELTLSTSEVTDEAFSTLKQFDKLDTLTISATSPRTPTFHKHLAGIPNLKHLYLHPDRVYFLSDTLGINAESIKELASAPKLETLRIVRLLGEGTVAELKKLTQLKTLDIKVCSSLEQAQVEEIRAALPNTEVLFKDEE